MPTELRFGTEFFAKHVLSFPMVPPFSVAMTALFRNLAWLRPNQTTSIAVEIPLFVIRIQMEKVHLKIVELGTILLPVNGWISTHTISTHSLIPLLHRLCPSYRHCLLCLFLFNYYMKLMMTTRQWGHVIDFNYYMKLGTYNWERYVSS